MLNVRETWNDLMLGCILMGWSVSIEKDQYTNQKPICYYSMRRLLLAINKKTDPKSNLNMHKDPKLYPKIKMHSRRRKEEEERRIMV